MKTSSIPYTVYGNKSLLTENYTNPEKIFTDFKPENKNFTHNPILSDQLVSCFSNDNKLILDLTFGHGGHSKKLLETYPDIKIIGLDVDLETSIIPAKKLVKQYPRRFFFQHGNFSNIFDNYEDKLKRHIVKVFKYDVEEIQPDGVIFDLGFSSYQFENNIRGFSITDNGPLDMRYDRIHQKISAMHLINFGEHDDLVNIFYNYGEEKLCHNIADAILECRRLQPITTTYELAGLVARCLGHWNTGFDPVEKTRYAKKANILHISKPIFTALRTYVNDELNSFYKALKQVESILAVNGKMAIISHSSMEDAILKFAVGQYTLGHPQDQTDFEVALEEMRKSKNLQRIWSKNKELHLSGALYHREDPPWEYKTVRGSKGNYKYIVPTQNEVLENFLARDTKLRCLVKTKELPKFEI